MDKVKSKVIALLMVIPLLLILTTSSVVKVTEIIADVPVESIKILGERTLEIAIDRKNDQGDYDNAYTIQTVIKPENATNKNVRYEQTAVAGKTKTDVLISADGTVRPLGTGTVKIVAIAGTHTASITITYTSDTVYSFSSEEEQVTISEGEEIALGDFCSMQPLDVQLDINSFEVANSLKAEFSQASLKLKGKCRGKTSFTIKVNGIKIDSQTGAVSETTYTSEIDVIVGATNTDSGISFAGAETIKCATTDTYTTEFGYSTQKFATMEEEALTYVWVDENGEESDAIGSVNFEVNGEETTVKVTITLSENAVKGKEYTLKIKRDGKEIATMTVVKADVVASDVKITVEKEWYSVGIQRVEFGVDLGNTSNASGNITYTFSSSDSNVVKFKPNSNKADMCAEGESVVSVTLKKNGTNLDIEVTPITIHVVDSYKAFYFGDMDDTEGGLKSELAVARSHAIKNEGGSVTGVTQEEKYQFMLSGKLSSAAKSEGSFKDVDCNADSEKMVWSTSDENIATVSNGKLTVKGNGEVKITVESAYNEKLKLKEPVNASITVNCRYDALEVDDYATLMYASENKLESVLTSDVMLAPNLIEELRANPASDVSKYYKMMNTTADYSYYKDNNIASEAVVKYCVEFTKSVYGNGHSINAQNITRNGLKTIFNGPLDIVRLKVNKGDANAAVKAQDNIVFLVKNDNITISNVELKGCSDSSLRDEGKDGINLSYLDYCGTVLEVIGNGLNLEYSKVNNGRTVVRIYGRAWNEDKYGYSLIPSATVEAERIKANISNCILERGREFILKIGTNQALKTEPDSGNIQQLAANAYENAAPALKKSDDTDYAVGKNYDDYFYNNYVLTDVTLKNSVLATSGLFAVGLESKFAGVCLHGYDYSDTYKFSELGWSRVAGTSYPAVLRLEGDVRFYDWKNIEDVNSETLIEGDEATIGKIIKIDFAELLGKYNSGLDEKSKLITVTENKSYVNGAIAFYGGGKNYSYVDTTGTSEAFKQLAPYTVGIDTLESKVVTYAAGVEPFRFMMYNKRTGNDGTIGVGISYKEQVNAMADNTAYSWVRRDPSKDEQ